ncbi:MAG: hypothetical protein IJI05_04965 [Erysipelotrichaceae bacterium]|nr:hypothetical protein [Erysipelotrichaceae bacterium]
MKFQWRHISMTSDRFIALILALIIIYFFFNEVAKLVNKNIRNRQTSSILVKVLLLAFLAVCCVFLMNYVFRWF